MTDATPLTIDRFVPHVSSVPATRGLEVGLFLRERIAPLVLADAEARGVPAPVVLFVHGGFAPPNVAYDLAYRNGEFSFMAALARAGFDTFALAHTGYGASPKPMMDDPANIDAEFQPLVIPHVLAAPTPPSYPFKLVSSGTEWDEIGTVVRFIMGLRGVDKVSFVGWSTGAPRAGGFAASHPEKVDRLVLFGPAAYQPDDEPPLPFPQAGAPTVLQSRAFLLRNRWADHAHCEGQIDDPGVQDAVWAALMAEDGLGAGWTADGEGVMRAPNRMNYGWRKTVGKIAAPTLMLLGEHDNYAERTACWRGLTAERRVFVKVGCASHFMQFECQRHLLHRLTRDWLATATVEGAGRAELAADRDGRLSPLPEPV